MTEQEQLKIFAKNLNFYIAQSGKQQKEIAKALNFQPTTFNTWCTGKVMPKMGKVQAIADYFGIGKSDLLDEKNFNDIESEFSDVSMKIGMNDERFQRIVIAYYNLPLSKKKILCDFLETFMLGSESGD